MKNLVLEGGGVKGIAYAGVFSALSSQKQLTQIENVLGVSAGAIAAVFLALGMTAGEIEGALRSIDYTEFKDDSFGAFRDTYRFVSKYGKHKGDFFEHWLADIVEAYTGNRQCTFAELANTENSKNLYIAATCLDLGTQVVFSKETHPSMSIVTACRASMSIPFVFVPVELDGHLYIDGGVLNNYPINFFDRKGGDTIGIKLETSEEIKGGHVYNHNNVLQYSINIFNIIYDNLQTKHISKRDWAKTIIVDCGSISAMDFKLKTKDKDALIQSGWKATLEFLIK